jgi:hypothetical protein
MAATRGEAPGGTVTVFVVVPLNEFRTDAVLLPKFVTSNTCADIDDPARSRTPKLLREIDRVIAAPAFILPFSYGRKSVSRDFTFMIPEPAEYTRGLTV